MSYNRTSSGLLTPLNPQRRSAWARLGTDVRRAGSAQEALAAAGLAGWNIRKTAMTGIDISNTGVATVDNPDMVMLVRDDPRTGNVRYLSTVGKGYGVHQNEAGAQLIDTLVAESGARGIGHAGHLDGGRKTFVSIELPSTMHVGGIDAMQLYLVVFNSHDGSSAFRVMLLPFRVFCANQMGMAMRNHVNYVAIRHTSKSEINAEEVRGKLGLLYNYSEAFERQAKQLLDTEMTRSEFDELINAVWPVKIDATPATRNRARRRHGQLHLLWSSAETQANIRGTRWAALQAVTEYTDHIAPAKNDDVRATRVLSSPTLAQRKQQAFDLLAV